MPVKTFSEGDNCYLHREVDSGTTTSARTDVSTRHAPLKLAFFFFFFNSGITVATFGAVLL